MRHEPRERIKGLYDVLTGYGEDAKKKIDLKPPTPEAEPPEERPVVVPPPKPPTGGASATGGAKSTTSTAKPTPAAKPVPITSRKPLPIWNPIGIFFGAVGIVLARLGLFLGLGAIFVLSLGFLSVAQYEGQGVPASKLPALQLGFLALVAYVLVGLIRVARSGGVQPFRKLPSLGHMAVMLVVAFTVLLGADWFLSSYRFDRDVQFAVYFTRFWPYYGPYGSMVATPSLPLIAALPEVPKPTLLLEPFVHLGVIAPILLFMPFVVGEYQSFVARWFIFLVRLPFLIVNLLLATLPIAILNIVLSDWSQQTVAAANTRLLIALLLSAICYVQIVVTAAVIGLCYRRVFTYGP